MTHYAHDTLLLCRGVRERLSSVLVWLARLKIRDGPKHEFYLGTERTTINSLGPFLLVLQDRIGLRQALIHILVCNYYIVRKRYLRTSAAYFLYSELELRNRIINFLKCGAIRTCRQITAVSPWMATRSISVHTRRRKDAGV